MTFGNLTLKGITREINEYNTLLNYLFSNKNEKLEKLTVLDAERLRAFENLKKLTVELQTRRLRYNAKSSCKYFTL